MSVIVNTCFFSLCVPLCFLYSRGPFLAAMFRLVFWILFLGAMMKQACWHSRRSKAYRGLPEARMAGATVEETAFEDVNMWQAPVSQKPPLREPRMWQGQVWEARPDGDSTRGKAKFRKRHGSRKWEEENSATRRRHRGKGRKRQKTPSPPYNVPHTPLGIRRAGCFLLLCFSNAGNASAAIFWCFWHPQWSFARVLPHPHPQASARALADMWIKMARFSGPCLATPRRCPGFFCGRRPLPFGGSHLRLPSGPAGIRTTTGSLSALARPTPYQLSHRVAFATLPRLMEIAGACNHSS